MRGTWNPTQHPRWPGGSGDRSGEFRDTGGVPGWARAAAGQAAQAFTDAELIARERHVNDLIEQNRHLDTWRVHRPNGRWTAERAAQQRALIDQVWNRVQRGVPAERRAIMTGGLAGAGKTTILNGPAGVDLSRYITVSADEMKDEMIRRGMIPDVPGHPELTPMERSALFHMESAFLADMLMERALASGRNVIIDATMGNKEAPLSRLARLRERDYRVRGIFVDIPVDTSLERAASRYRYGMREYGQKRGSGGRPVPPRFITGQRGAGRETVNRQVFDELRREGVFDEADVYDNSGEAPRRVEE